MLITDYDVVAQANPTDLILLEGSRGTKIIRVSDFIAGGTENVLPSNRDAYFDFLDSVMVGAVDRRTVYRGKKIELPLSDEIKQGIKDGTFKGLFIGDYFEVTYNSTPVRFLIADFDRYLQSDITMKHHLILIQDLDVLEPRLYDTKDLYINDIWFPFYFTNSILPNNFTPVNVRLCMISSAAENGIAYYYAFGCVCSMFASQIYSYDKTLPKYGQNRPEEPTIFPIFELNPLTKAMWCIENTGRHLCAYWLADYIRGSSDAYSFYFITEQGYLAGSNSSPASNQNDKLRMRPFLIVSVP